MKKLYKIIIAFLIIFFTGLCITYFVITSKFNSESDKVISSTVPIKILEKTTKVVSVSFQQ